MKIKKYILIILAILVSSGCASSGSSLDKITNTASGTYKDPSWSPDGEKIAVIYDSIEAGKDGELLLYNVIIGEWDFSIEVEGSRLRDVTWINNNEFVLVNDLDYSNWTNKVTFYNLKTRIKKQQIFEGYILNLDALSLDGKLAIVRDSIDSNMHDEKYGITIFDINTGKEEILYIPQKVGYTQEVAWNQNGKFVAFTLNSPNLEKTNRVFVTTLSVLNIDNKQEKVLIEDAQMTIESISWSRDGNHIIARIIDNNYHSGIGLIAMDGSITYLNSHNTNFVDMVASPVEDVLALTSLGRPGSNAMYLLYDAIGIKK